MLARKIFGVGKIKWKIVDWGYLPAASGRTEGGWVAKYGGRREKEEVEEEHLSATEQGIDGAVSIATSIHHPTSPFLLIPACPIPPSKKNHCPSLTFSTPYFTHILS